MNITNPNVLYLKAGLFIIGGTLASALILMQSPTIRTAMLLAIAIWCFARAYYFAFYVIERYVDPSFRYSGVVAFFRYLIRKRHETDQ